MRLALSSSPSCNSNTKICALGVSSLERLSQLTKTGLQKRDQFLALDKFINEFGELSLAIIETVAKRLQRPRLGKETMGLALESFVETGDEDSDAPGNTRR